MFLKLVSLYMALWLMDNVLWMIPVDYWIIKETLEAALLQIVASDTAMSRGSGLLGYNFHINVFVGTILHRTQK